MDTQLDQLGQIITLTAKIEERLGNLIDRADTMESKLIELLSNQHTMDKRLQQLETKVEKLDEIETFDKNLDKRLVKVEYDNNGTANKIKLIAEMAVKLIIIITGTYICYKLGINPNN